MALVVAISAAMASSAAANLLGNPGFENEPFTGAEEPGTGNGWTGFGNNFRVQQTAPGNEPISTSGALGGTVALKNFGEAGAYQEFAASPGDVASGSIWAINPDNADVLVPGQVAAVNIEWRDAADMVLDVSFGDTIDASTPQDVWTQLFVGGTAPAETAMARFVLITGPFDAMAGGGGGAPRWDEANFEIDMVPEPTSLGLIGMAFFGMIGFLRRR